MLDQTPQPPQLSWLCWLLFGVSLGLAAALVLFGYQGRLDVVLIAFASFFVGCVMFFRHTSRVRRYVDTAVAVRGRSPETREMPETPTRVAVAGLAEAPLVARVQAMAAQLEQACYGHGPRGRADNCAVCHEILEARRLLATFGVAPKTPADDWEEQQVYMGRKPKKPA